MSLDQDAALLAVLAVSFVAAMFLAAAETSLLRVSPVRAASLAASAGLRGRRLGRLLDNLSEVLSAILLAALLAQITAATVTGILAERWFGSFGVTLASIALTVILFVYGEAIPKTYAVRHADRVALALAFPISVLDTLLRPIVKGLVWIADLQMPGKGITTAPTITEDELKMLASRLVTEGQITATDLDLIQRAFRFGDRRVDDVMVPRLDVVAIRSHDSVESVMAVAVESGHRRLPIYVDTIENLTGVVRLRNLVGVPADRRHEVEVGSIADEPLVAPESKRIFALLSEMQDTGIHLAVVVDEFGGTAGIVTLEDIAEELLGSLRGDRTSPQIIETATGRWSVDAGVPVEDLAAAMGESLPDGDWNTVAGLVMGLSGHVPAFGDEVDTKRLRFRVAGQRGRRITRVEVSRRSDESRPSNVRSDGFSA